MDIGELQEFLEISDPEREAACVHSDRVFDIQFREWGVDGMACQYLFVKDERRMLSLMKTVQRTRASS